MNKKHHHWAIRLTVALLATNVVTAAVELEQPQGQEDINRFTFSARFGFNIDAKFKNSGAGGITPSANTRRTPGDPNRPAGDPYNYDNGYVYSDISGSSDGLTWYWGYDDTASQFNGTSIQLTRTTTVGSTGGDQKLNVNDPLLGFEITYNRELGRNDRWRYGIEAAFNYMNMSPKGNGASSATVTTQTDSYNIVPGTTPPDATGSPYQQTYSGPFTGTAGFVISNIISGTVISSASASVVGQYKFRADLFGFRLGPYIEFPLGKRTYVALSGGFAVNVVSADASWTETATSGLVTSTSHASGDNCDAQWGGYLGANLAYQFSRRWAAVVGIQWQDLSTYSQTLGAKKVELDMSNSYFVQVGLSYSF